MELLRPPLSRGSSPPAAEGDEGEGASSWDLRTWWPCERGRLLLLYCRRAPIWEQGGKGSVVNARIRASWGRNGKKH